MATKRCSICGINYPTTGHRRCYGCGRETQPVANAEPHEDWREASKAVRVALEQTVRDLPLITPIEARVTYRDGHYFISSWDVCNGGFQSGLRPDMLIRIGNQIFEVAGYSDARREYWLFLYDPSIPDSVLEPITKEEDGHYV